MPFEKHTSIVSPIFTALTTTTVMKYICIILFPSQVSEPTAAAFQKLMLEPFSKDTKHFGTMTIQWKTAESGTFATISPYDKPYMRQLVLSQINAIKSLLVADATPEDALIIAQISHSLQSVVDVGALGGSFQFETEMFPLALTNKKFY